MTELERNLPVPEPPDPLAVFGGLLNRATPRVWITWLLIAANVAIFVAMLATGVDPMTPTTDSLVKWGADYGPKTTSGQWWRLGSSIFRSTCGMNSGKRSFPIASLIRWKGSSHNWKEAYPGLRPIPWLSGA